MSWETKRERARQIRITATGFPDEVAGTLNELADELEAEADALAAKALGQATIVAEICTPAEDAPTTPVPQARA